MLYLCKKIFNFNSVHDDLHNINMIDFLYNKLSFLIFVFYKECPNPPHPRSLGLNDSTKENLILIIGKKTNCAIL